MENSAKLQELLDTRKEELEKQLVAIKDLNEKIGAANQQLQQMAGNANVLQGRVLELEGLLEG